MRRANGAIAARGHRRLEDNVVATPYLSDVSSTSIESSYQQTVARLPTGCDGTWKWPHNRRRQLGCAGRGRFACLSTRRSIVGQR